MAEKLTIERAEQLSREKQTQEALLAQALYNRFNQGAVLSNLQKLALDCIGTMLLNPDKTVLQKSCSTEDKLGVWTKISGGASAAGLEAFYASNAEHYAFSASDVSDIIRLFGQWIEDGGDARVGLVGGERRRMPGARSLTRLLR